MAALSGFVLAHVSQREQRFPLFCHCLPNDSISDCRWSATKSLETEESPTAVPFKKPVSVMQNDIEQGFMDTDSSVVLDEAQLPEPVHEEADTRTGGSDHFCQ
jgi:hypothetical protein